MRLNVFVNHSDIMLAGYLIRFGPDSGITYELPSSAPVMPSTIQKISIERVNGNPNVVRLAYSFTNNVCSYVNLQPPLCPAIDGDLIWRKTGNIWTLDMQASVMDLYPFKQINEVDAATQTFRPIVTLPNLMGPAEGLSTMLTISQQLAMDMARMFRLPGCLQE
jgi:hypothetical protein